MPERTYLTLHRTRWSSVKYYVTSAVIFVFWALLQFDPFAVNLALPETVANHLYVMPIIAALPVLIAEIRIRTFTYRITNYRFIERRGLFHPTEQYASWDKVVQHRIAYSFLDRMIGIGRIELNMGSAGKMLTKRVPKIRKADTVITELIQRSKRGYRPATQQRPARRTPARPVRRPYQ